MFTNHFFTAFIGIALAVVLVFTVQEAIATSAVTSEDLTPSREADTRRWQAMAEYYQNQSLGNVQPMERSRAADTARWEAMAEYYQSVEEAQNLQRGRAADAARWMAMADYYQRHPELRPATGSAVDTTDYFLRHREAKPVDLTDYFLRHPELLGGLTETVETASEGALLDECFDVSLSEVAACREASQ